MMFFGRTGNEQCKKQKWCAAFEVQGKILFAAKHAIYSSGEHRIFVNNKILYGLHHLCCLLIIEAGIAFQLFNKFCHLRLRTVFIKSEHIFCFMKRE